MTNCSRDITTHKLRAIMTNCSRDITTQGTKVKFSGYCFTRLGYVCVCETAQIVR
jgi:hypothetical protein